MTSLVLLRHGQSIWNRENRFSGWSDVDLSGQGLQEARTAGRQLKEADFTFDIAYTSVLKRAIRTLWITLDEMDLMWLPVVRDWRLNERHYGALQGLNKAETATRYGAEKVHLWRRGLDPLPPALDPSDPRFPGHDPRYRHLRPEQLPRVESLRDTINRFMPFFHHVIEPDISAGKRVLIVAHGNTLRALIKYLDNISDNRILDIDIPTGVPLVYELNVEMSVDKRYYLGNPERVAAAMQEVVEQERVIGSNRRHGRCA